MKRYINNIIIGNTFITYDIFPVLDSINDNTDAYLDMIKYIHYSKQNDDDRYKEYM